ncbi:hypothetical protein FG152_18200 [Ochrobactrum sp. XJ1]|nr:hypothetical protein [Ochrobactrum sp. XJ1]
MTGNRQSRGAAFSLGDAIGFLLARKTPDFLICLAGNAMLCILLASFWQFAILNILCFIIFVIRHWNRPAEQRAERDVADLPARRAFLIFLLQVLIACDVVAAVVDSFSASAIV